MDMVDTSEIVLLGSFNPMIFHPEWFERYKILPLHDTQWAKRHRPEEVALKDATGTILNNPIIYVTHTITQLNFQSLAFRVLNNSFYCETKDRGSFNTVKEAVIKTFSILEHTPINAVGINFVGALEVKKKADSVLKFIFMKNDLASIFGDNYNIGGSIIIKEDTRIISCHIGSSLTKDNIIDYLINFHSDIEKDESISANKAVDIITNSYDASLEYTTRILQSLLGEYTS
ncbi:hypothetical protein MBAV_006104 [Candidatus Magnetobacterium bavaricum]|uniref:Uncharacterized protein n=1 Tax=Candidatus Magnetobacterium bavaricum TaxID=29290 RepID=A0A0F3GIN3_9BACT|nr:hypothetical protein MBAV_006104 [Candidatus Magnetobacterium bavaricum]